MPQQAKRAASFVEEEEEPFFTPQDLEAIQSIEASFLSNPNNNNNSNNKRPFNAPPPPSPPLHQSQSTETERRRLPASLVALQHPNASSLSPRMRMRMRMRLPVMKFSGQILYSRTFHDVDKAATSLLNFIQRQKTEMLQIALGLDIEWKPTFKKGVPPGKVAVMQICFGSSHCHVLHLIHSGIPPNLRLLLEDPILLKVGAGIGNDASKFFRDYDISIKGVEDLSFHANRKLGGCPQNWGLASLTEKLLSKQLKKPSKIRLGNWETPVLSKEQLEYAATDAFASWYLYQAINALPEYEEVTDKSEVEGVPQQ